MSVVLEATAAVALLDSGDDLHGAASRAIRGESAVILDVTRSELFGRLAHLGGPEHLMADMHRRGVRVKAMGNELALAALELRTAHPSKWFPVVDAAVVALAIQRGWRVLSAESRWPSIPGARIEVLGGDRTPPSVPAA